MKNVSQVLRAAMVEAEKRGVSLYRIAKACRLDDSIVYRFYHNECGLALTSVDRLCKFLALELVESGPAPWAASTPLPRPAKKAEKKSASAPSPKKPAAVKKTVVKKASVKKTAVKKASVKRAKKSAKGKKKR